jgi:very-short-patch-repair endonuclease
MNPETQIKILKNLTGYEFISEYKFHPKRKWRFDFCHIESRTAIEIEGGVWTNGRHIRGTGFIGDMEKYNAAALESFAVLRFRPDEMNKTATYELIKNVIEKR